MTLINNKTGTAKPKIGYSQKPGMSIYTGRVPNETPSSATSSLKIQLVAATRPPLSATNAKRKQILLGGAPAIPVHQVNNFIEEQNPPAPAAPYILKEHQAAKQLAVTKP